MGAWLLTRPPPRHVLFLNINDFHRFLHLGIPFYERLFLDAVQTAGFEFLNNEHILDIAAPVAIIHADDDEVMVP